MSPHHIDISVVVTAHHEGRLAHHSMRSLFVAIDNAQLRGLSIDFLVILDNPDKATTDYFASYNTGAFRIATVAFGDPGLARNFGVSLTVGKYIAFLDADNLFSENWLHKAFCYLEQSDDPVIAHPAYYVIFGTQNKVWRQISSTSREFNPLSLLVANLWDTVCMGTREIFLENPFSVTTQADGFGYEDWHFNCETLASGYAHCVVPETVYFIRRKGESSQLMISMKANRVLRPTKFFDPLCLSQHMFRNLHESEQGNAPVKRASFMDRCRRKMHDSRQILKKPVVSLIRKISGMSPHYEPLCMGLIESLKRFVEPKEPIPQWLIEQWKTINTLEPQLFPSRHRLATLGHYSVSEPRIGRYYLELYRLYGENISHVFLIPWLKNGGADLAAINYIEALSTRQFARGVVVIVSVNTDSPWKKRLPAGVQCIEFGSICCGLTAEEQELLLMRLLLQKSPEVVHNINSDLGYRIYSKYGLALGSVSRLYASSFCDDISQEGNIQGYPSKYLPECFDVLQAVLCDCQYFADTLHVRYAFDKRKLIIHYQPCATHVTQRKMITTGEKKSIDVLWASRLDRQKRPDILINIAESCKDLPITFHVYGTSLLDPDRYSSRLKMLQNVICYGPFDGLESLPTEKYDIFLYTSQWDGIPNILLEALSVGLPVIAPNVCGIGEVIINDETGFLIDTFDDVTAYVSCLKRLLKDRSGVDSLLQNAHALLAKRHSRDCFVNQLQNVQGYVTGRD